MSGFKFNLEPQEVARQKTKYRSIATKIPVPESLSYFEDLDKYESVSMHGQLPVVWDRAEDFCVSDKWGNTWIDFTSTIFVANAGHSNKRIIKAIRDLLDKPLLHTYTYASEERTGYLKYLIENTPAFCEKAYLLSAGTEATEALVKLIRMKGQKEGKRKPGIISFTGNWHGRTMGAQMLSSNDSQKEWIGHKDPYIFHLPFPYPWIDQAVSDPEKFFEKNMEALLKQNDMDPSQDICGFVLETFQGWGSVFYPKEFVQAIDKFAKKHNIVLTFDEMQSGFGRTGKLFGYMHYEVEPDMIALGKGASSGFPLSIVLGRQEILDIPEIGSMSSTHSANPVVCAAGKANLEALLEDGLIENSEKMGIVFHRELNNLKEKYSSVISFIQGKGLVAAVIFNDKDGKPLSGICDVVAEKAMQKGLLVVHTGRESIKLAPPLCINEEALLEGLSVFEEALVETLAEQRS